MRRWALVPALLVAPALLFGQVAVTPSGWTTTAGPAIPVAPGAPVVVTPEIHLGTYSPSPVGATNATGNNVAGASNSTIDNVAPVAGSTQMQVQYAVPYPSIVGAGSEYATFPASAVSNARSGVSSRLPYFDRGAAQFVSVYDMGSPQTTMSLGELAREWRQKKQSLNARTFTNEDINRIDQQYGPPTGGITATAVNAGTNATANPPNQPPSNVSTDTAMPQRRSPFQPPAGMEGAPPTSAPPPQPQAMAQYQPPVQPLAERPAATDTQQASGEQGQGNQSNPGTLPRTASQMPTFLVLGGLALLAGMLLRRRNQRRSGVGF